GRRSGQGHWCSFVHDAAQHHGSGIRHHACLVQQRGLSHLLRPRRLGTVTWTSGTLARSSAVIGGVPVTIWRSGLGGVGASTLGGLSGIDCPYHFDKRDNGRFHTTRSVGGRTSRMWHWMDVGPDGGRAVCERLGVFLV